MTHGQSRRTQENCGLISTQQGVKEHGKRDFLWASKRLEGNDTVYDWHA